MQDPQNGCISKSRLCGKRMTFFYKSGPNPAFLKTRLHSKGRQGKDGFLGYPCFCKKDKPCGLSFPFSHKG